MPACACTDSTGIDPVIPTVTILLACQYCQTKPLTFTNMSGQQEALAVTQETEMVAQYLCKKFHNLRVRGYDTEVLPPMQWSLEYLMEVDLAANIIWRAFWNQSKQCSGRIQFAKSKS